MHRPCTLAVLGTFALALAIGAASAPKLTYVDLQPKANHELKVDLHETEGNNLASSPQGELDFQDVKFKIGPKLVHVQGEHAPDAPEEVTGIKIGAAFQRLAILHATGYGEPDLADGTEIGAYTVHYADKTTARIPIVYGEDLRDWWINPDRADLKRAKVAWKGENAASKQMDREIALYAVIWKNPHPEKKVVSLDMSTAGTECDPFLVALTLLSG